MTGSALGLIEAVWSIGDVLMFVLVGDVATGLAEKEGGQGS